jgi:hypothetical protein
MVAKPQPDDILTSVAEGRRSDPIALEAAVKALVEAEFGKELRVTPFPDDMESHKLLSSAEILLGYRGGDFNPPQHGSHTQMRTVAFEAIVLSRSMSGHNGAVEILDRLRLSLQGKKISAFPIRITKDTYLGRTSGQWWYSLEIVLLNVPAFARAIKEDLPLIRQITTKTEFETLEVKSERQVSL